MVGPAAGRVQPAPATATAQQGLSGAVGVATAGRPEVAVEQTNSTLPVALVVPPYTVLPLDEAACTAKLVASWR